MNWCLVFESLKAPLRQALLAFYAFAVNSIFSWLVKTIGFEFTEEQKAQLLSYGTPIIWGLLSWIDRILHNIGKQEEEVKAIEESVLTRGLTRF